MEENKPDSYARSTAMTNGSNGSSALPPPAAAAAVRYRLPQRDHSKEGSPRRPPSSPLSRRRSSLISYSSLEDLRQSFADDIVDPRTNSPRSRTEENEITHWHSTPLAFAFLPALGGLFFKDGKAFTSDILLLGLAAVFLNWSIRLPWDWYYSAQTLRRDFEPDATFDPEPNTDDVAVETASSIGDSPVATPRDRRSSGAQEQDQADDGKEEAAADLRKQETMALMATFLFPLGAAYLLHIIRAQLSTSSTGLVSDYNLSIFLLAAEIRPCRQVVRLVSNRTLHLQRIVAGVDDPASSVNPGRSAFDNLTVRIAELEARLGEGIMATSTTSLAQKTDVNDLSVELRKRYEPRLEGLERAVRRYEKRSTTLAITTEQRLLSLEHRIQEALSLAAVAAQHSKERGAASTLPNKIVAMVLWPVKMAWNVFVSPFLFLEELYSRSKGVLLGTTAAYRSTRRKHAKPDFPGGNEKPRDKPSQRRVVK